MAERRAKVLMTLADVAWPVDAGKRLRSESMVRAVAARCDVDVVVLFADADPTSRPVPPDVPAGWQVIEPQLQAKARAGRAVLLGRLPWQIAVQDWAAVQRRLADRDGRYDLVWFGGLDHFRMLHGSIRARRMIVDCDDVETEKLQAFLALKPAGGRAWLEHAQRRIELPLWGRIQRAAVQTGDAVLVCSELDRDRLVAHTAAGEPASGGPADAAASRIVSIPNTYPEPTDTVERHAVGSCTVAVVANFGTDQNVDAAEFAARQVLPALRGLIPDARLRLIGRRSDRLSDLSDLASAGVDIVGPVDSVASELAGAHVVLVPIRFGGGTRLKVIEAMAYRVPVVSTTAGAEGLQATGGVHLALADTPADIAAAIHRIVADPSVAAELSVQGRQLYERRYRPQATIDAIGVLLDRLLGSDTAPF